jgi:2-keto-4-pentenoate hydratase
MTPQQRQCLADLLVAARRDGRQLRDLPADLVPADHAEGYAVNALVARRLGWTQLGWKIAGTNAEMQQRLRTGAPIYGRTFAPFEMRSPARLDHAALLDPLVECELFFRLGRALPPRPRPYTADDVADAVATVHGGIEIAECRFALASLPPMPAILADGAASGRYVIGDEIKRWRDRDLAAMAVSLSVNGTLRRTGFGRDVMGDPINSVTWLANQRGACGDGLAAGALISSGTATGMLLARAGDRMRAQFGEEASVEVAFD